MRKLYVLLMALFVGLVSNAQVSITATAGTAGPTAYTTLKAAFDAINAGTHAGAITVDISANTTETATTLMLNSSGAGSASYTSVLIRPTADAVTVSGTGSGGTGFIVFNGADNVTINGDNPNSAGTNRNLTIRNNSIGTYNGVIRIALAATVVNTADNITIRNTNLIGGASGRNISTGTSTAGTENLSYGILLSGGGSTTSATTAPANLTSATTSTGNAQAPSGSTAANLIIENNTITNAARGIAIQGAATTVAPGLQIRSNIIGNSTVGAPDGVYSIGITAQGSSNGIIAKNTVNVEGFIGTSIRGIDLGSIISNGTFTVEGNDVQRVRSNNASTYGAYGINLAAGNNCIVRNNFVSGVLNSAAGLGGFSTTFGIFGIRLSSGIGHIVQHNSVHLSGVVPGTSTSMLSASVGILATTLTGLDVRNNIFSNVLTGAAANSAHVSVFLPTTGTNAMNLTLNNNAYYTGTVSGLHGIAHAGSTYTATPAGPTTFAGLYTAGNFSSSSITPNTNLRAYTTTLSSAGTNDAASFATTSAAPFVSATDLHINPSTPTQIESGGANVGVTLDIDEQTRNATTPDIGADEGTFTGLISADVSLASIINPGAFVCDNATQTVTVRIKNDGSSTLDFGTANASITLNVTGAATATLTATVTSGTLAPGATLDVNLAPILNMAAYGTYNFAATITMTGDGNTANNSLAASSVNVTPASLPQNLDFTGFTGSNLTTVFPNWYESKGATTPTGTLSNWTSSTIITGSGTTAKINLDFNTDNEWIIGPKVTVPANGELKFKAAITDFASAAADVVGMQGTDDKVIVRISTDCGATWTNLYTFEAATTTSLSNTLTQQTLSLSSYAGQNVVIAFFATEGTVDDVSDYDFHIDDITILNNPPCTTPPTGGSTATSVASACSSASFILSVTGSSAGTGLSYQWQSSPDNSTWSDISGAIAETLTTTQTSATYYRRKITCSGNSEFSASIQVLLSAFTSCYCSPNTGNTLHSSTTAHVNNVAITGTALNYNSGTTVPTNGYSQVPSTTATGALQQSVSYSLNLTLNSTPTQAAAWVDFNRNGTFEASEYFALAISGTTATATIAVPAGATLGQTGLRVRSRGGSFTSADACLSFPSGETEDYIITIDAAPTNPCVAPVDQASSLVFGTQGITSQAGSFTAAGSTPSGYLVVRSVGALTGAPVDGTSYTTGAALGNGTVVQSSSAVAFTAASLIGNTEYTYTVFAFNNSGCINGPAYNPGGALSAVSATCPATPTGITATNQTNSTFRLNWTSSKGGAFVNPLTYTVDVSTESAFTTGVISGSPFTVSDSTTTQNTMRFELTGLTTLTQYFYRIKGNGCNAVYSTTASTTTFGAPPDCNAGTVMTECATVTGTVTSGTGGWDFSGTYPNNSIGFGTPGKEAIFRFTPSTTGVYYLEITAVGTSGYFDYFYKPASAGCSNTGWLPIDDNNAVGKDAIGMLQAGVEYYILLDAESTTAAPSHTFKICKATTVAPASFNACISAVSLPGTIPANSSKIEYVVDAAGNLIASLDFSTVTNAVGTVSVSYLVNNNAVRRDANNREYLNRNITITTTNVPATPATVNLYFLNTELQTLIDEPNDGLADVASIADLKVTKTSETCAQSAFVSNGGTLLSPVVTGAFDANVRYVTVQVPSFSTFYMHGGLAVLPANIVSFSGKRQGTTNQLKWTVAQERDVQAYEVERSENGRTWNNVGSVTSLGNTSTQRTYSFTDNNITGYRQMYRLRQVDVNGSTKVSNTVQISGVRANVLTLTSVFPNPAFSRLNVLVDAPVRDNITITVLDAVGRIVKVQRTMVDEGSNTVELNVASLASGSYLLKVSCESNCQPAISKFVKE